jgi:site-specific DNA-methyltransferase (adenine-specific)
MLPTEFLNKIIQGDNLEVLKTIPDECVDCIITSPPYWNLRDYGVDGQIGLEDTLEEYLLKLLLITAELKRVLKKTGTLWWNHGDSYGGTGSKGNYRDPKNLDERNGQMEKSLLFQAHRLAIRMIDEQGWILRNQIIWHKPNVMPASVKDRFTVDYEPIFFFSKEKEYYFEPQYEPYSDATIPRMLRGVSEDNKWVNGADGQTMAQPRPNIRKQFNSKMGGGGTSFVGHSGYKKADGTLMINPLGRNKRTVWRIATKPSFRSEQYSETHFATFPEELIAIPIKSGCPEFICKKCGIARKIIYDIKSTPSKREEFGEHPKGNGQQSSSGWKPPTVINHGLSDCGCVVGWNKGIVLDPFMGSGTTAKVARDLGRNFVGIELNPEYIKLAKKRLAQTVLEF